MSIAFGTVLVLLPKLAMLQSRLINAADEDDDIGSVSKLSRIRAPVIGEVIASADESQM
jgi:hypothetical protein